MWCFLCSNKRAELSEEEAGRGCGSAKNRQQIGSGSVCLRSPYLSAVAPSAPSSKSLSDFGGLSGSLAALEVGEVAGEAFDASMTMTVYKEIF